jgi:hypothetical protein
MQEEGKMTDNRLTSLPAPTFAGGDKAITLTPVVGTQRSSFAPTAAAPPEWWADARIPLSDAGRPAS